MKPRIFILALSLVAGALRCGLRIIRASEQPEQPYQPGRAADQ